MRSVTCLAVVSLVFGAACSSKVADQYPTVDSFCGAKAQAECQVSARCAVTVEACVQSRSGACLSASSATMTASARTYTAPNAPACLDAVQRVYAAGTVPPTELDETRASSMAAVCAQVFLGRADRNEACSIDTDCAVGRMCAPAIIGTTLRVCADRVVKSRGEFCSDPGSVCEDGTYCATAHGAPICAPRAAAGDVCSLAVPCADGLRCDGESRCSEKLAPGAICVSNDDCSAAAPMCDRAAGWVCDVGLSFAPPPSTTCIGYGR
jgi:hypothetical protein